MEEIAEIDFADDLYDLLAVNYIQNRIVRKIYERAHLYEDLDDKRFLYTFPFNENFSL